MDSTAKIPQLGSRVDLGYIERAIKKAQVEGLALHAVLNVKKSLNDDPQPNTYFDERKTPPHLNLKALKNHETLLRPSGGVKVDRVQPLPAPGLYNAEGRMPSPLISSGFRLLLRCVFVRFRALPSVLLHVQFISWWIGGGTLYDDWLYDLTLNRHSAACGA